MKLIDWLKAEFDKAETFAEMKFFPWFEHMLSTVAKDAVNNAIPFVETAGAQVAAELISGQPVAAIATTVASIALQAGKNMEKAAVSTTAADFSAAITGYVATLQATGATSTGSVAATAQAAAPAPAAPASK